MAHPLQVGGFTSDFVGFGVYKSNGVPVGDDCPSDNSHWNVYVDYVSDGLYDCRSSGFGEIGTSDNPTNFKLSYGDCFGVDGWRTFLDNAGVLCLYFEDFTEAESQNAGSETVNYSSAPTDAGLHYDNAQKLKKSDSSWDNWTSAHNFDCEELSQGYQVRNISSYEYWAEDIP